MLGATYVYTGVPSGWPLQGPPEPADQTSRGRQNTLAGVLIAGAVFVAAWLLAN
jgi:hypothetical protein